MKVNYKKAIFLYENNLSTQNFPQNLRSIPLNLKSYLESFSPILKTFNMMNSKCKQPGPFRQEQV